MSKNLSNILRASAVTNVVGGTAGQVHYQSATDTTAFVTNGTAGQVLTSNGSSAPSWSSTVATATNLASGVAGAVPYQSASGTTGFTAAGTAGQVLTSAGTGTPTWTTLSVSASGSDIFNSINLGAL